MLDSPLPEGDTTELNSKLETAEKVFVVIYCIEAATKIIALGFAFHPKSYLRNGWNILDFAVVVVGEFAKERERVEHRRKFFKLRRQQQMERMLDDYLEWISKAEDIMLREEREQHGVGEEISEKVFLGLFIVEMILKLYGLEPRNYFNSAFNRFDFIVVLSGIVEMFLDKYLEISFGSSVLRSLRLLRVFKFTRFSTRMDAPRTNFDSFFKAMLAVFQIMTGEDWNTVMYDGIEAAGGAKSVWGILASLYFVALVIIGNYTLLNVFLAIAVDNLANAQALTRLEEQDERQREQNKRRRQDKRRNGWAKAKQLPMIMAITKINQHSSNNPFPNSKPVFEMDHHSPRGGRFSKNSAIRVRIAEDSPSLSSKNGRITRQDTTDNEREDDAEEPESLSRTPSPRNFSLSFRTEGRIVRRRNIQRTNIPIIRKSSMFIFGPDNPVRRSCHWLVNLRYFDTFILFIILISSVLLAFEDPVNDDSNINKILGYFDYVITAIFALEVVAKTVFQCMVFSLKNVRNILIITALFYFIFAVIGVQLFKGKFFYCTDTSKKYDKDCNYLSISCYVYLQVVKREWKKWDFTFDSVPYAMLTLFSSSTGEGWPIAMYHTIDATKVNEGPRRDHQLHMSIYYVCFVVVFSFFFLNIFVALIIVTFQEQGEKEMMGCELNRNQRDCIQFAMTARPRQRYMPENKKTCFYKVWRVVDSKPFEIFIMTMIVLNAGVLMLSYDDPGQHYDRYLEYVNMAFTFVFLLEAILKLIAFKLNYFRDYWNIFDFIIVVATLVEVLIELAKNGGGNTRDIDPSFFRLFRAARLVKLLRQGYTIRILLWTFFQSFKSKMVSQEAEGVSLYSIPPSVLRLTVWFSYELGKLPHRALPYWKSWEAETGKLEFRLEFRSKEKLDAIQPKRRMHRSLKFFRRPFGRTDSNSEDDEMRRIRKSVRFKEAPMDLTDINPTIISTDNEDDDPTETTYKKRKSVKHSYKNPVAIEDARNEMNSSTDSQQSHASCDVRSPPMVRIHVSSPLTLDVNGLEKPSHDDRNHLRLDTFPDVIKSAESSPRHSNEFYARARLRDPKDQRSKEIINQLNEEISQAVRSGQSAYCIFGMFDNDEETWC
ncbi:hypothetical protein QZH41_004204 [Actinostola sp. cb2023]|nr:hypothetical protein QZH41_004204 [Actinostola sp. cb2023]